MKIVVGIEDKKYLEKLLISMRQPPHPSYYFFWGLGDDYKIYYKWNVDKSYDYWKGFSSIDVDFPKMKWLVEQFQVYASFM